MSHCIKRISEEKPGSKIRMPKKRSAMTYNSIIVKKYCNEIRTWLDLVNFLGDWSKGAKDEDRTFSAKKFNKKYGTNLKDKENALTKRYKMEIINILLEKEPERFI